MIQCNATVWEEASICQICIIQYEIESKRESEGTIIVF